MGQNARLVATMISLVAMIISLSLSYTVLVKIQATEFMWLLYVLNVPIVLLATALARFVEDPKK